MAINIATNFIAFIIVLGFLIFAHEGGHFIVAKMLRVKVLVFSFGFGKRLFGFHKGGTDYRVSLVPLGGYVKMAGDIPEDGVPPQPNDFLARPKWQRFLILVAGPGMNLLIAIAFLAGFYMMGTEVVRDSRPVLGSILSGKPAAAAGLQPMDEIVEANGETIRNWEDFKLAISMNANTPVQLKFLRAGRLRSTTIVPARQSTDYGSTGFAGVTAYISTEVGKVVPRSAAERAGFKPGDFLVEVGGRPVSQITEVETQLETAKGAAIPVRLRRGTTLISTTLPALASAPEAYPGFIQPTVIRRFGLAGSLRESVTENVKMLRYTFTTLGRLFRAEGSVKDLSGPISIARISGEMLRTGWRAVIFLMANISLQLGVMNLLPIPVLDGGHIFILLVEGAARRDLSLRVKERIQQLGFAVLAALMLVVLYNDVIQNVMLMRTG
jgi:regulator of sigma E protease